jgi:hypothetical protein
VKYEVKKLKNKLSILDQNKKKVLLTGYAFIDMRGHCIIIVYGSANKKATEEYLNKPNKPNKK